MDTALRIRAILWDVMMVQNILGVSFYRFGYSNYSQVQWWIFPHDYDHPCALLSL